jgi:hypothetical protein
MTNLNVLCLQPTNEKTFGSEYNKHLQLLHEKTEIPTNVKPYTITKFLSGTPQFYQMFSMLFHSLKPSGTTLFSQGIQNVSAIANRISTLRAPLLFIVQ